MNDKSEPCCKPCDCHCHRAPTYVPLPYPLTTPYPYRPWWETPWWTITCDTNTTTNKVPIVQTWY